MERPLFNVLVHGERGVHEVDALYRVVRLTWGDVTIRGDRTIRRLERLILGGT